MQDFFFSFPFLFPFPFSQPRSNNPGEALPYITNPCLITHNVFSATCTEVFFSHTLNFDPLYIYIEKRADGRKGTFGSAESWNRSITTQAVRLFSSWGWGMKSLSTDWGFLVEGMVVIASGEVLV